MNQNQRFEMQKEEFIQSCLEYRWLDETRTKYIDRFFILLVAVIGMRFQFDSFFTCNEFWLIILYGFSGVVAVLITRSVVMFRRQQRGHGLYVKAMRGEFLQPVKGFKDPFIAYRAFVYKKRVYVTKWTEFILVILSIASPCSFLDFLDIPEELSFFLSRSGVILALVGIGVMCFLLWWLAIPWYRFNVWEDDKLDWAKH